jgi:hypothetical protein
MIALLGVITALITALKSKPAQTKATGKNATAISGGVEGGVKIDNSTANQDTTINVQGQATFGPNSPINNNPAK